MKLNILVNNKGAKKTSKRLGRGIGSGKGKTCGRGGKGQTARSGVAIKGFEGGQTPMIKRLPKRGFNCPSSVKYVAVNLSKILDYLKKEKKVLDKGLIITKEFLVDMGIIKNPKKPVKLLFSEIDLKEKISFKLDAYSSKVKKIIEESGGSIL